MNLALLLANLILALAIAPLLNGIIKKTKAGWQNRLGPPVLQPWFDIWKYLSRESVVSENASWVFRFAPYVYFSAHLIAAVLIPMIQYESPLSGVGDVIVLIGLLAIARFALALAALDTGSNFGGMGASRELAFASLIEPAFMLMLFAVAIPAGSTAFNMLVGNAEISVARILSFGALLILVIAETGRLPVDNPDTHLELTMAHEGMLLEYSGRSLGLLLWATHIKQLVMLSLVAALYIPWGISGDIGALPLLIGTVTYLLKLGGLGFLLAVVETANVKLRIFRVPELLGVASLLGILAITSTYVIGG